MSTIGLRCSTAKSDTRNRPQSAKSRDKVKELLTNKLLRKFAQYPSAKTIVPPRVARFVTQNRLTEASLHKLEKEILDAIKTPEQKKEPERLVKPPNDGNVKKPSGNPTPKEAIKTIKKNEPDPEDLLWDLDRPSQRIEYNEDKDWDAILKFNAELHQEEVRQEEEKKRQQKMYVKTELEKQKQEKLRIEQKMREEFEAYKQLEKQHLQYLENKDKEKELERKKRKLLEKERLDKQMKEELLKKKMVEIEDKKYENSLVERIKKEIEEEKEAFRRKKEMEREYHRKMIEENEVNKKKQMEQLALLREQEKKDLLEYTKMLEQQEADRLQEVKNREKKTQDLMNRMADTVIKEMDKKKEEEELKILQYQQEKELREQLDDEERIKRIKEGKKAMRMYLDKQMEEKKRKEMIEKKESLKQAEVWKKETTMQAEEEKTIKQKMFKTNKEHAEYLKSQMKIGKKGKGSVMNREEYLMNRKLIEEIESKQRAQSRPALAQYAFQPTHLLCDQSICSLCMDDFHSTSNNIYESHKCLKHINFNST
eukprot:TRINITY_DN71668_c2_g1_i1.p1 TRINITY_DN71668_c2_g1~~TRINITY_DN71668_c2_g1_i1.p1  ORF type:complete len:539 (-),score=137.21 TRINITY_DN71668_c2_g1_i1:2738-4354(-)